MADLPRSVHFVTHAPIFDVVRLFVTVFDSEVAPCRSARKIAIFDHISRVLNRARSHVYGSHDISARFFCPVNEIIDSDLICFDGVPGAVKANGSAFTRADSVLPVVARKKIAARIAHKPYAQIFYQFNDITSESLLIGGFVPRLVNARVHGAPQVLDKRTEQLIIDRASRKIFYNSNFRFHKTPMPTQ